MPKAEKGSLKDLGKRIKAKGLQKLKFFCQMCEKQCRDANGFKCHLTSESHLRQMKIFSERAGTYMDRYSKEFEKAYLDTLRLRHSTSRTNANNVYQQVIQDKHHIHMNSTIWASLTDFCKYLGKTGKCVVEETEQGWYVTYVERNAAKLQQVEWTEQRQKAEQAAERATHIRMQQQRIEAARALDRAGGILHVQATPLERPPNDHNNTANDNNSDSEGKATTAAIQFVLHTTSASGSAAVGARKKKKKSAPILGKSVFDNDEDEREEEKEEEEEGQHDDKSPPTKVGAAKGQPPEPPKAVAMTEREFHKTVVTIGKNVNPEDEDDDNYYYDYYGKCSDDIWLCPGILVRIIDDNIDDGSWFRCKAVVDTVTLIGKGVANLTVVVEELDRGEELRLGGDSLETVAPKHVCNDEHETVVRIVRGKHRGAKAWVMELDKKRCRAVLKLRDGTVLRKMDFDDFSLLP